MKNNYTTDRIAAGLARRHAAERRFQRYGQVALLLAFSALAWLLVSIVVPGMDGLRQTKIALTLTAPEQVQDVEAMRRASARLVKEALFTRFPKAMVDATSKRALLDLLASTPSLSVVPAWKNAGKPERKNFTAWIPASDKVDMLMKGHISPAAPEADRPISDQQIAWVKALELDGKLKLAFNTDFFSRGDSRDPARAGFLGAIVGSLLTLIVCLGVAFPIGVMAAMYLEEFAPKGRLTDIIEVNINNLAAVPSIVYGLLGLAVFLGAGGLPRSAPLVGGLTLAMMTLPVIIITTRAALRAVPDSIRMAALGLGATKLQTVLHHTLPLALPGIMTGAILGLARAIGETAPLLMIGMVAFIVDVPRSALDSATVMPVQIYLWASSAEMGFAGKTSAGIMILILLLLAMNALAIWLRRRFERQW